MRISIYSRKSIELLFDISFPGKTAVISFYDPDRYNNDKKYKLVDYSGKANSLLYIPLDDFQTELPEAEKIAEISCKVERTENHLSMRIGAESECRLCCRNFRAF